MSQPSFDTKRLVYYVFIAGMAVLFALQWGPGSRGCKEAGKSQPQETAATVNGKDIPLKDYARAYAGQLQRFRAQGVTPDLARQIGAPRQVLDQLITFELVSQAAENRGIAPSDEEVLTTLKKNPDFQREGQFDPDRYRDVLRDYYRTTDVAYEGDVRRELAARKLLSLIDSAALVSDDEVKVRYFKDGNKAKITFVRFMPTMFASQVPAAKPGETDAWAKAHESEIQQYYVANQLSYHEPEKVRLHQILIRVTKEDPADKQKAAKDRLEELKKQIEGGKDIAELAKQVSDDTETKDKGGDTGFIDRMTMAPSLANAVFALQPGQLTDVVETPIGYYLAKLDEKKPPETKTIDQVRPEIAAQLFVKEKAKALAKAEAEKALKEAQGGKSLKELYPPSADSMGDSFRFTQATKPEAASTSDFASTAMSIPQLGTAPMAQAAIFAQSGPRLLDQVFEVGDGYAVINVDERKTPSDADFEANKAALRAEAEKAKSMELHESFLKGLRQSAVIVTNERAVDQVSGG